MQKIKKVLKKLTHFTKGSAKPKAAQAAKKSPGVKQKTQALGKKAPAVKTAKAKPAVARKAKKAAPAGKGKVAAPAKVSAKPAPAKAAKPVAPPAKGKKVAGTPAAAAAGKKATAQAVAPAGKKADKVAQTSSAAAAKAAPVPGAKAPLAKGKKAEEPRVAKQAEATVAATAPEDEDIVLTDADGRRYCRVKECDQIANVDAYCRYHYLLFWKNIQNRKKILSEGKLERYVEELTARYPDKFLELLRKDLRSEKDFTAAIQELEIDDTSETEFEDEAQSYLDEVRGMGASSEPAAREEEDF